MLYNVFYYLLKFASLLYFRKIRLYQTDNIPDKNPLIICSNHGNSFLDAILIAVLQKRKLHFLARADAFNTPFKRWFLAKINMMPIYRIRDGREELKNNNIIFEKCKQILNKGGAIVIFPEGNCVVEKRLRTFKTGFVQLAFDAEIDSLQILPVTINYSKPLSFYTEVSLDFSKPINVIDFKNQSFNDYTKFSKLLITETIARISDRMIVIPFSEEDDFYEQILEITRNGFKESFLQDQLNAIKHLNDIKLVNTLLYNDLKYKLSLYFNNLTLHTIKDEAVASIDNYNKNSIFAVYPFYFLGLVIHFIPASIIDFVVNKKVKEIQFKSAVRLVFGMFVYLIYIPILFVLASNILTFESIFLIGAIYFHYLNFHHFRLMNQINKMKKVNIDFYKQRGQIVKLLNP